MIDYTCQHCGAAMSSPDSRLGETETCPACGRETPVAEVPLEQIVEELQQEEAHAAVVGHEAHLAAVNRTLTRTYGLLVELREHAVKSRAYLKTIALLANILMWLMILDLVFWLLGAL